MNLAAVMVSVAEANCKPKQDSKRRSADKLVFGKSSISSTLLVCGNSDFGWREAGASLIHILLLVVVPIAAPTQSPMCEGKIVEVIPHRLCKGLVITL